MITTPSRGRARATENFAALFSGGSFGTDGPGSKTYSLHLTGSNVPSGLFALDATDASAVDGDPVGKGDQIVLNINAAGDTVTGSVGATTYFTISIDAVTGIVTFAQSNNLWHPLAGIGNPDDPATLNLANANLLQVVQTIVDADGDHVSTPINVGQGVFSIQDSGPELVQTYPGISTSNLVVSSPDITTVGGTGIYHYKIGTDANTFADAAHSDFLPITLTGTVGGLAITSPTVTWQSESASTAVFHVSFSFTASGGSVAETGTLTFDKAAGTYKLVLDHPLESTTVVTTSQQGLVFHGYQLDSSTVDNNGPTFVKTAELNAATDFWVQFYADHQGTGNPPSPPLIATDLTGAGFPPGDGLPNNYTS